MSAKLETGAVAPQFDLPSDSNGRVTSASLAGKKVVLYFYPKDDTSGCTQEAIEFNSLRKDFEAAGAVVLGVSPDSGKSHDKFKAKHGLEFVLISDEEKTMLNAYGVWVE
ncbi:MAG: alkyl hydroperoxide reductase, partial [Hyphomicrobiales bacterium]|nr:alkyl hydroperoxide reductase [Hyphomicrobiales bacterium]